MLYRVAILIIAFYVIWYISFSTCRIIASRNAVVDAKMRVLTGWFANGLILMRNLKPPLWHQWTVSFPGISTKSAKTNKMVPLFISHFPINFELISMVRRSDHITASLVLQLHYLLKYGKNAEDLVSDRINTASR